MRRSRAIIGGSHRLRAGVVLLGASMLTGCPSAVAKAYTCKLKAYRVPLLKGRTTWYGKGQCRGEKP
jgi:hypothetical protein